MWVPTKSRSNIEQTFFNEQFGAFFRINTLFIAPKQAEDADEDVFLTPYLELLFHLQVSHSLIEENEESWVYIYDRDF